MTTAVVDSGLGESVALERSRAHGLTHRELELGAIVDAYNQVTEKLKVSHEKLTREVRRLRQQLKQKDRELERRKRLAALGEMAAGVAHEVRNPLGGILLYATMLEEDLRDQPAPRRIAERVAGAARKLDEIVCDILAFAEQRKLKCRPIALMELITDVVELLKPRWIATGCEVSIERSADGAVVEADAGQLQRALLNVISNAVEAAGRSGHVWISMGLPDIRGEFVRVSVADDGPGVPEELRDRIFNPFFTTRDSGTGLGLAIVHRIVELHGGRVTVTDRKGGGAVFTFFFPKNQGASDCGLRIAESTYQAQSAIDRGSKIDG